MSSPLEDGILGRPRCCDDDFGGSHYHCGSCGEVSSSMGHWRGGAYVDGKWVKFEGHVCCPTKCHLGEPHPGMRNNREA